MIEDLLLETEERMQAVIDVAKKELAAVRTGRANPALLNKIIVDYYGTPTPLNQLASITAPDARLLVVQPWDKNSIKDVEKAILKSELGLTPNVDGNTIRLPIPQLTEERRKELVKMIRKDIEEKRVAIRNIRRDSNDKLRAAEKNGELPEDDARRAQDEVQKLTDKYIAEVDRLLAAKEEEILAF
ncbi:MAG: ribosome recycling factor [Limnochordia bacterium]|nr:ribosome recycling factor [Bacillota bacterium]